MKFEAVLFDMDGLLIDSERVWEEAMLLSGRSYGVELEPSFYRSLIGLTWAETRTRLVNHFGASFPLDSFIEDTGIHFDRIASNRDLAKPGLYEIIEYLELRSVTIGVATSTSRKMTEGKLARLNIRHRLEHVVCGDEVREGKPHPEPYLKLASALCVDPKNCVVLEDSYNGVRSAHAAGASVIMVPDLLPPTEEMREMCIEILESLFVLVRYLDDSIDG